MSQNPQDLKKIKTELLEMHQALTHFLNKTKIVQMSQEQLIKELLVRVEQLERERDRRLTNH